MTTRTPTTPPSRLSLSFDAPLSRWLDPVAWAAAVGSGGLGRARTKPASASASNRAPDAPAPGLSGRSSAAASGSAGGFGTLPRVAAIRLAASTAGLPPRSTEGVRPARRSAAAAAPAGPVSIAPAALDPADHDDPPSSSGDPSPRSIARGRPSGGGRRPCTVVVPGGQVLLRGVTLVAGSGDPGPADGEAPAEPDVRLRVDRSDGIELGIVVRVAIRDLDDPMRRGMWRAAAVRSVRHLRGDTAELGLAWIAAADSEPGLEPAIETCHGPGPSPGLSDASRAG